VQPVYTTDGEMLFRQEAYFHYLFGVNEDGFWGALDTRNVSLRSLYSHHVWCVCLLLLQLLLVGAFPVCKPSKISNLAQRSWACKYVSGEHWMHKM
jgi:hypothetical protein